MKNNWPRILASEYCSKVTDGTHDSPKETQRGRYLVTSKNLGSYEIDFSRCYKISEEDYNKIIVKSSVEKWDILISMIGTVGLLYQEKNEIVPYACKNVGIFKFNKNETKAKWMYYYLKSPGAIEYIRSNLRGTTQMYIPLAALKNMPITVPPLSVQQKIVSILDTIDNKIGLNNKINENLFAQINSIYRAWFQDFSHFSNLKKVNSELGVIPKDWEVHPLSDVTINIKKRVGTIPCKVLSAVNTGKLQPSEDYFIKQVFSKDISKYILVEPNDFAYNPARVNIGSIGINDLGVMGCVSPVYVVFKVDSDYVNFFKLFIKSTTFKEEAKTRAIGSVRQAMSYNDFALIKIAYPPRFAINEFNNLVNPLFDLIKHVQDENDKLIELRDTLLPKLMSGEIDVTNL